MNLTAELRNLGDVRAPASLRLRLLGDAFAEIDSEMGGLLVAFNADGISAVNRAGRPDDFELWFRRRMGRPLRRVDAVPEHLVRKLRFDLRGLTSFERDVLLKTAEIPRGQVRSYGWVAREIGRPAAVRAVGTALANNPIPYFIPCHRVVRSDGVIGNYGMGGPEAKKQILRLEGADPDAIEAWARRGVRYHGSDTTHIFCFPTCSHARRVQERHRVSFGSDREAFAAGYRPCKVCRPALVA